MSPGLASAVDVNSGEAQEASMSLAVAARPAERSLSLAGLFVLAVGSLDIGLEQSLVLPALPALARSSQKAARNCSNVVWASRR